MANWTKEQYEAYIRKFGKPEPSQEWLKENGYHEQATIQSSRKHRSITEILKDNQAEDSRPESCSEFQEQQKPIQKQEDRKDLHSHRSKKEKVDAASHPKYRIAVMWLISDNRVRDNDGMLSTIMDSLISATRRLSGMDTGKRTSDRKSPKR